MSIETTAATPLEAAPKAACLIRVEGVNHSQFIFDTTDLSTVRGGGLILLDAVEEAARSLGKSCQVISSGASSGLFRLQAGAPQTAVDEVRRRLNQGKESHACFVVAAVPESGDFAADNETLIALNRHEQMTSPSLQVPATGDAALGVCAIDRIRPAQHKSERKVKGQADVPLSASVHARRKYGLERKQAFYASAVPESPLSLRLKAKGLRFADDFSDIADKVDDDETQGKLAVFYADGNRFGAHQRPARTPEAWKAWDGKTLKAWDLHIKALRRGLLAELIEPYLLEVEEKRVAKIRFETLLWGGDELLFVVPASRGMALVSAFLSATEGWRYPDQDNGQALTHAMGLVFCHSNTPIAKVTQLAKALGDHAKEDAGRDVNSLHTVALESFDHVGAHWADYLQRTYHGRLQSADRVIKGPQWGHCITEWTRLKNELPKGRLNDFLQALLTPNPVGDDARQRLTHDLPDGIKKLLESHTNDPAWFFLAAELWDYLPEATVAPSTTANQGDRA